MAPVLERERKLEGREEIEERHRVLIAATVAAVLAGRGFRIAEIKPVQEPSRTGWKRRGPVAKVVKEALVRRRIRSRGNKRPKEQKRETSHPA